MPTVTAEVTANQPLRKNARSTIQLLLTAYTAFTAADERLNIAYTLADIAQTLRGPEWATPEDLKKAQSYLEEAVQLVHSQTELALLLSLKQGLVLTAHRQGRQEAVCIDPCG